MYADNPKTAGEPNPYANPSGSYQPQPYNATPSYQQPQPPMTGTLMVAAIPVAPTSNWNSGLFACFDDFGICLAGTFCLGFLDAHNNAKLSDRKMKFTDWLIGLGLCFCTYYMGIWCLDSALQVVGRGQIRARYNFPERAGDDFLATLLCCFCSSCQIARELKGRTTPPGIGGTGYGTAPPARNPSPYSGMA